MHDTECPYWGQVSVNSTKPNQTYILSTSSTLLIINKHYLWLTFWFALQQMVSLYVYIYIYITMSSINVYVLKS